MKTTAHRTKQKYYHQKSKSSMAHAVSPEHRLTSVKKNRSDPARSTNKVILLIAEHLD